MAFMLIRAQAQPATLPGVLETQADCIKQAAVVMANEQVEAEAVQTIQTTFGRAVTAEFG
jgi:hypothetical protein